jgi:hypothetical protein
MGRARGDAECRIEEGNVAVDEVIQALRGWLAGKGEAAEEPGDAAQSKISAMMPIRAMETRGNTIELRIIWSAGREASSRGSPWIGHG